MEENSEIYIDPEKWTQFLLAVAGDKELSAELIQKIAEKTGLQPDKVEEIIAATTTILANLARSN